MAKAILLHFTSKFSGKLTVFPTEMHSMSHLLSFSKEIFIFLFQLLFHTSLLHLFRPSSSFLSVLQRQFCVPKEMHLRNLGPKKEQPLESILSKSRAGSVPWAMGAPQLPCQDSLPTPVPMKNHQYFPVACHTALGQQGTSRKCLKNFQVCAKRLWIANVRDTAT